MWWVNLSSSRARKTSCSICIFIKVTVCFYLYVRIQAGTELEQIPAVLEQFNEFDFIIYDARRAGHVDSSVLSYP